MLLASSYHTDEAVDILNALQETVEPPALIGCVTQAVIAGSRAMENEPAVAVWLASGLLGEALELDFVAFGSGDLLTSYRFDPTANDLHVLLSRPYTFLSHLLAEHLNRDLTVTTVVGGWSAAGEDPARPGCSATDSC